MMKICAGIVTYNPDIALLRKCVKSIVNQVAYTFIIDNGSQNNNELLDLEKEFPNMRVIINDNNGGIAKALNQIAEETITEMGNWFLTLDQDSVCQSDLISKYLLYCNSDIGMICPKVELRVDDNDEVIENAVESIEVAITSGSLVNIEAWKQVGGFWEYLFIDKVDDDFCCLLKEFGYKIIRINDVRLEHEIGYPREHKFAGKRFYSENYKPFRYYYIARNSIIVSLCHKNIQYSVAKTILKRILKILLVESNKFKKMNAVFKGIIDAIVWAKKYGVHKFPDRVSDGGKD